MIWYNFGIYTVRQIPVCNPNHGSIVLWKDRLCLCRIQSAKIVHHVWKPIKLQFITHKQQINLTSRLYSFTCYLLAKFHLQKAAIQVCSAIVTTHNVVVICTLMFTFWATVGSALFNIDLVNIWKFKNKLNLTRI